MLNGDDYTLSADTWSFGVIVWELITREEPWASVNPFAIAFQVAMEGTRLTVPESCPAFWRTMMSSCWRLVGSQASARRRPPRQSRGRSPPLRRFPDRPFAGVPPGMHSIHPHKCHGAAH